MIAAERVLPHSIEAERALLGAILVENAAYLAAITALNGSAFFRDAHRRIYEAMTALAEVGKPIDFVLLCEELQHRGDLEEVGGPAYIASLVSGVPIGMNVAHYGGIIREKAEQRAIIAAANVTLSEAYETESPSTIVERGVDRLMRCVGATGAGFIEADTAVRGYAAAVAGGTMSARVRTGHADLDVVLSGGLRRGDLAIIAARPSIGKTAFALGIGEHIARWQQRTAIFELEMDEAATAARLLARRSHVATERIERMTADEDERERVGVALRRDATPLLLEFASTTVAQIAAWCRRAQALPGGLVCAVVDYLQLLLPERRSDSSEAEIAGISRTLKRLAKDLHIVVIALSQLSRAPESRRDKRPTLSDLRGSGALEQDCDVAILLYREEMHKPGIEHAGTAEAIVAKHRSGPTGVVRLAFIAETARFEDLARPTT